MFLTTPRRHDFLFFIGIFLGAVIFVTVLILSFFYYFFISSPSQFNSTTFFVAPGQSLVTVAENMESSHIVRSRVALQEIVVLMGKGRNVVSGEYLFDKKANLFTVAYRITKGDFRIPQPKVVIPEGSTNEQIAVLIKKTFSDFDTDAFLSISQTKQGFLFPDTYFFLSTSTKDIVSILTDTFDSKVRVLQSEALNDGKNWNDIVKMASILEKEANNATDFKLVSGILWKRIEIKMPLQVDSATSTYKVKGLPELSISNPGLDALDASLHPLPSSYLYYLTGKDGKMHYAETFDIHKKNIEQYLK
ncbi:MAG: endolytic transglycosylase MltG [Candidatus Paceibacterota bacterium]|jgi:UPF0755 protein